MWGGKPIGRVSLNESKKFLYMFIELYSESNQALLFQGSCSWLRNDGTNVEKSSGVSHFEVLVFNISGYIDFLSLLFFSWQRKIKRFRSDRHRTDSILQQYALHARSSYFRTSFLRKFSIFCEDNPHVVYLVLLLKFLFKSCIKISEENSNESILVKVISADFATSFAQLFILKSLKQK